MRRMITVFECVLAKLLSVTVLANFRLCRLAPPCTGWHLLNLKYLVMNVTVNNVHSADAGALMLGGRR